MISIPKPAKHIVAHICVGWDHNWIFSYCGLHCLSPGFLVHKSCLASKNKIAASNSTSSDTSIRWDLWSALHLN